MCLDNVHQTYNHSQLKTHVGYKVFTVGANGNLTSLYFDSNRELPRGVWLDSREIADDGSLLTGNGRWIVSETGKLYRPGWHIYPTQAYALHSMSYRFFRLAVPTSPHREIIRVLFRDVVAKGTEGWPMPDQVVVARQILIPKENKDGKKAKKDSKVLHAARKTG